MSTRTYDIPVNCVNNESENCVKYEIYSKGIGTRLFVSAYIYITIHYYVLHTTYRKKRKNKDCKKKIEKDVRLHRKNCITMHNYNANI